MFKVLTIPNSGRDVTTFASVYNLCNENDIKMKFISLDAYHKDNINYELEKHLLDYRTIDSYKTKNIQRIIKEEKPNLVLIASDYSSIGRSFLYAAKKSKIPVYLLITGNITRIQDISKRIKFNLFIALIKQFFYHFKSYQFYICTLFKLKEYIKFISEPFLDMWRFIFKYDLRGLFGCDLILLSNYKSKELLLEKGINQDKIKVIGDLRYNINLTNSYISYKNKSDIVIGTTAAVEHGIWSAKQRREFFQEVIKTVVENTNNRILVAPHPREDPIVYENLLKQMKLDDRDKERIYIEKEKSTNYLLQKKARLYISVMSTTLNEAILLNVPTISYNPFNNIEPYPYVEEKVVLRATNPPELKKQIKLLLFNEEYYETIIGPNRKAYIERNITILNREPKEVFLNLLKQELNKNNMKKD
ncbi:MAG: hypothetical protein ACTSPQ_09140 [Candidatus Helarchaeota archaeon]